MKHEFFTCGLVVAFVTSMSISGLAGDFDQFLHLVKHRDMNGNLVVPEHSDVSPTKQAPVPQATSHEKGTLQMPPDSQVDSDVEPTPVMHRVSEPSATVAPDVHTPPQTVSHVEPTHVNQSVAESHQAVPYDETASVEEAVEEFSNDEADGSMKKIVLPFQPGRYAFRSTNWDMSIHEVKATETADFLWELDSQTLLAGEHRLGYRTSVEDVDTVLTYSFENDRLINAKYVFETEEVENDAQPLSDYKKVKNWIIQTYGPPQSEETLWVNELYQYAPELWGRAIMRGHLTMVSEWKVDGTSIVLLINGGDESVGLVAEFSSTNHTSATKLVHLPPSFFSL